MKTSIFVFIIAVICEVNILHAQEWHITGNNGTNASSNFIGTKDKIALNMRTNNVVRLSINSTGNVGIGTTKPKSKLDVSGGITAYNSYFIRQDGAPGVSIGRSGANYGSVGYGLTFTDTTDLYRFNISDFSSMLSFRGGGFDFNTAPAGTAGSIIHYTRAMTILQNGNVGIGISQSFGEPAYKLHVVLTSSNTTPAAFIRHLGGNDGLYIQEGSDNMPIGSNFILFEKQDAQTVGAIVQTSTSSVSYNTTSDKRLKNIMGTTQKGLPDLMKIKVYDYTFKTDTQKQIQTGFMAQELYDIFPQAVSKPRDNNEPAEKDPWMVDYGRVTPLIIKAVQEQQQIIDELKKSNNDLKEQNESFQKQIDELKAMIVSGNKQPLSNSSSKKGGREDASLQQNIPNPFNHTTTINYTLPKTYSSAKIIVTGKSGKILKELDLSNTSPTGESRKGAGSLQLDASTLASGAYQYSLYVDGKLVDARQMLLAK